MITKSIAPIEEKISWIPLLKKIPPMLGLFTSILHNLNGAYRTQTLAGA